MEIERKFLVDAAKLPSLKDPMEIQQGYLQCGSCENRIRLLADSAFLTVKLATPDTSTRYEYEMPIPRDEAVELLQSCEIIHKVRYHLGRWTVDVYQGQLEGLVTAEIELNSPAESIELPDWIYREVTGDPKYLNANLAMRLSSWREHD